MGKWIAKYLGKGIQWLMQHPEVAQAITDGVIAHIQKGQGSPSAGSGSSAPPPSQP